MTMSEKRAQKEKNDASIRARKGAILADLELKSVKKEGHARDFFFRRYASARVGTRDRPFFLFSLGREQAHRAPVAPFFRIAFTEHGSKRQTFSPTLGSGQVNKLKKILAMARASRTVISIGGLSPGCAPRVPKSSKGRGLWHGTPTRNQNTKPCSRAATNEARRKKKKSHTQRDSAEARAHRTPARQKPDKTRYQPVLSTANHNA